MSTGKAKEIAREAAQHHGYVRHPVAEYAVKLALTEHRKTLQVWQDMLAHTSRDTAWLFCEFMYRELRDALGGREDDCDDFEEPPE